MKFSVPTNWQDDLILNIKKEGVVELYGKLARDYVGGGRASATIPHPSRKKAKLHIQQAHSHNLEFDYLLNSTCLDNSEFTRQGQKNLMKLLDWLTEAKVNSITVSMPYLLELIKKRYPHFKVHVSTQAGVNTIQRAKCWQDLGADKITLSLVDLNRDFRLLRQIRKTVKSELQLIANTPCLFSCSTYQLHANANAHASQAGHPSRGLVIDYCRLSCAHLQIENPTDFIRGTWIRPEDIHYYEDAGIDYLKLVDRNMPTRWISIIVEAYTKRSYAGNLLDLFPGATKNLELHNFNLFHKFAYYFHPFKINILKLFKKRKMLTLDAKVYIDNKKLDGFIEHFLEKSCYDISCEECGYCEDIAKKTVKILDEGEYNLLRESYRKYRDEIISGSLFKYTP